MGRTWRFLRVMLGGPSDVYHVVLGRRVVFLMLYGAIRAFPPEWTGCEPKHCQFLSARSVSCMRILRPPYKFANFIM